MLGNICKVDYYMFAYQYTSEALMSVAENVVCVSVVISSVDTEDLKKTDVDNLLVMSFGGTCPNDNLYDLRDLTYAALGKENEWAAPAKKPGKEQKSDENDDEDTKEPTEVQSEAKNVKEAKPKEVVKEAAKKDDEDATEPKEVAKNDKENVEKAKKAEGRRKN